jgi:hypothetical protein
MEGDAEAQVAALVLRGHISLLPEGDRAEVDACIKELNRVIDAHGNLGVVALALVGAERCIGA